MKIGAPLAGTEAALETNRLPTTRKVSLAGMLEMNPRRFLLLFTLVYFVAEFCSTVHRPLFFDELCMYYIADVPSIGRIWDLIAKGMELNPPLPFWLTWMVHHSIGKGEFLSRLPSLIGFWAMCICLYQFVRRRSDVLHGFVAMLLPLFTFAHWFGTCARGYGLLLGFSAGALLCWQYAIDRERRTFALIGIAVCLAGAVSCHYYAVYVIGAIGTGEIVGALRRKKVDIATLASIALGLIPLIIYRKLISTATKSTHTFWVSSSPQFLYDSYAGLIGSIFMVVLAFFALTIQTKRESDLPEGALNRALTREELVTCSVLAGMPLVFFASSLVAPVPFYTRYVLPVVLGSTVLSVCFVHRFGGANVRSRRTLISILIWFCLLPWAGWHTLMYFIQDPYEAVLGGTKIPVKVEPTLPLVVDNVDDFLMLYFYSPETFRTRLFTLDSSESSLKYLKSNVEMNSIELLQGFHDVHLVSYQEFISSHHEFLIARVRAEGWILQKLIEDGDDVELLTVKKDPGYFADETLVFRVKIKRVAAKQTGLNSINGFGTEVPRN